MSSEKQVALVVGASRGIGRQVAIDLAKNGYKVIVSAKSISDPTKLTSFPPDPNSNDSTISTVEKEIRDSGGEATAIPCDVRDYGSIKNLVATSIQTYGCIDVLLYNSGAIWWSAVSTTTLKRFRLLQQVNPEGLYACVQEILPHFTTRRKGRIIVVSPPIYSRFFRGKTAYAMGKVGMSVLTMGLGVDFRRQGLEGDGVAVTSIWPATSIQSAATIQSTSTDPSLLADLRHPSIYSDAILAILCVPASTVNGRCVLDEDFLRECGVTDFSKYSIVPGSTPRRIMPKVLPDLRVEEEEDEGRRVDSVGLRGGRL